MGDPKRIRKKYVAPPHPWQKSRIEEEKAIIREFGLKNKQEVWRMRSKAKDIADQAKRLTSGTDTLQSKKETELLLARLYKLGLLPQGAQIESVLNLTIKDVLERRLQTIVFKKGLAKSPKQARQFITHRHIVVNNKVITSPSYIVTAAEEAAVAFIQKSALADPEHAERAVQKEAPQPKKPKEEKAEEKKEGKKKKEAPKKAEVVEEKKEARAEEKKEEKKEAKVVGETKEKTTQEKSKAEAPKEKPGEKKE